MNQGYDILHKQGERYSVFVKELKVKEKISGRKGKPDKIVYVKKPKYGLYKLDQNALIYSTTDLKEVMNMFNRKENS